MNGHVMARRQKASEKTITVWVGRRRHLKGACLVYVRQDLLSYIRANVTVHDILNTRASSAVAPSQYFFEYFSRKL